MSKYRRKKLNRRLALKKRTKLKEFFAAALAIPAIAAGFPSYAQDRAAAPVAKLFYADYEDRQKGADRMRVRAPIAWIKSPLPFDTEFEGTYILDSMSGASPYYHNTLTGASGLGVEDTRRAGDAKLTKYFEDFSLAAGGVVSSEDDYISRTGLIESRIWSEDKNTTLALGFSGSSDDITSTLNPDINETRRTFNFLIGVTQVIDPVSIIQTNLTYSTGDGYFSDPYKTLDHRPASREQWALLTRYNRYIESLDGSLHLDYRFYTDTWGINSHTFEAAWYQPLGNIWTLRPNVRYYSQGAADFFTSDFPPDDIDRFLSADQRVSGFGGLTTGIKIIADMGKGLSFDLAFSYLQQRAEWKLGSGGSSVIDPFYARFISVGLTKTF